MKPDPTDFVITVQQEIGRVKTGEAGEPALRVSFGIICDHFADNATNEPQTFTYLVADAEMRPVEVKVTG